MISNELNDSEQSANLLPCDKSIPKSKVLTEEVISLLEERLMVNLTKRKIGEVVVRKEIETLFLQVQVPVRREKLIVEQVSPEYKRLAEIDLGQVNSSDNTIASVIDDLGVAQCEKAVQPRLSSQGTQPIVYGETHSPQVASDLLDMIAHMPSHNCEAIRIEVILKDSTHQDTYKALFDRHCNT
jgi:Domain of unknown function (DUF2382)